MSEGKTCSSCKKVKEHHLFYSRSKNSNLASSRCKTCVKAAAKKDRESKMGKERRRKWNNSEKGKAGSRNRSLLFKYGITEEEYAAIFLEQGSGCAICGAAFTGETKNFPVDHDHSTGQVRGILCWRCNTALGAFGDDTESLRKVISYLEGGYLSWDAYFIEHARVVSRKSKDPSTQVGAVLVKDRRIVSSGYNGLPAALEDKEERYERPAKYDWILHAEENAIIQCTRPDTGSSNGATMYVYPLPPCRECAKAIIQSGVTKVVYCAPEGTPERWKADIEFSLSMLKEANVEVVEFR